MHDPTLLQIVLNHQDRPVKILLERPLPDHGTVVLALRSGQEAQDLLEEQSFDVSQLDFELPGVGRVESRRRHRGDGEGADLLVIESEIDAASVPESALEIDDQFLTKPMRAADLQRMVNDLVEGGEYRAARIGQGGRQPILGDSEAMRRVLGIVERVAAGQASVLVFGETGTGKTLIARRIHDLSPRADRRFVAINCSAFQDQLLESELFGHEKGAFTGAVSTKPGLFELADGGTLFLDEVGDMSSAMQAKLLHVLDDGEMRRVGGREGHKVDVRVVAASNKDLAKEVKAGRFREDLLFRLRVIYLEIPPLRERQADIPRLVEYFLERHRLAGQPRKQVSPEAIQILTHYAWPGNVRELTNTVEGLTLLAPGPEIRAEDLPAALRPKTEFELQNSDTPLPLEEIERLHIQRALRHTEGKKAPAARLLGIDVKTLSNKIKRYSIEI